MVSIITLALISGAIAERMKFSAYLLFITLWSTCVCLLICHWVWGGHPWGLVLSLPRWILGQGWIVSGRRPRAVRLVIARPSAYRLGLG